MDALVINTLGIQIHPRFLKPRLSKMWNLKDLELINLVNNYYIVQTKNIKAYERILNGGPWTIFNHCILVQRWNPQFNLNTNSLGKVALWVRLTNIPIQCYDKEILWRMKNCIRKTLKVDANTLSDTEMKDATGKTERGKFARISVKIDLQKKTCS